MIKKHWKILTITSVMTLLPVLAGLILWSKLPDKIPVHWNASGEIDGWSSKPVAVFVMPLFLLAVQWLCTLGTAADPKRKNHPDKIVHLVLWIIPVISVVTNGFVYMTALGQRVRVEILMPMLVGLVLGIVGNYLPKCKQNYTIGIKIPWTLQSEENWNRTHRFAGYLWVICAFIIILTCFLGNAWIFFAVVLVMCIAPVCYSFALYKKGI